MLSKKKKIFVLVGMVALLVLTGTLNIILNNNAAKANTGNQGGDYQNLFMSYRTDRESIRTQTILQLNAIIDNPNASPDAKLSAEASLEQINFNMELEVVLENLVKAMGFEDAFVTNSTENVNIIVKQEILNDDEANKILDVILRETTRDATNVIIIPIK